MSSKSALNVENTSTYALVMIGSFATVVELP